MTQPRVRGRGLKGNQGTSPQARSKEERREAAEAPGCQREGKYRGREPRWGGQRVTIARRALFILPPSDLHGHVNLRCIPHGQWRPSGARHLPCAGPWMLRPCAVEVLHVEACPLTSAERTLCDAAPKNSCASRPVPRGSSKGGGGQGAESRLLTYFTVSAPAGVAGLVEGSTCRLQNSIGMQTIKCGL